MNHISLSDVNILLIEPSDTQRKIISSLLIKENVGSVDSVSTLAEAKSVLRSHGSDVVVSAMYFEDGTGLDLIKHIKGNVETASIPFMLVSSENRVAKLEEFKQAGVAAILPKPFEPLHLARALNATLDLINSEELDLELYDIKDVRVLLVDDSRLARNHIHRVLEGMGLSNIKEAENGATALTLLKDNIFDLVVTDYNMPEMDGRELSEYIRFNPDTSHIPIIMVTSEATNSAHMANIQHTGVNALCDKPFEAQEVRKILATLLGS
ncbi:MULTISPECIES: response regulator transcription factor [Alteromonadaceae]|uniref:response regulator transcription factor n=1 Tax=Alteromonadaceae TaxID=72275 RepID=UPI001C080A05|nr:MULTISPECIES: response regulator [Aliiglaciecola]MBU2878075.1 response regulator [Aliiglaciecola lipolytica]MDO6709440.1 response regulator [Aliiglaciecola sp. 2_MG-2023]MDO6750588.1 response regulator [Aliiglaciecola sp. 1_MG-2023]